MTKIFLASAAVLLSLFPVSASAFVGGDGSPDDPYQISTCLELQDMSSDLSAAYVLINDIDCSATTGWNGGEGFVPVGTSETPFAGTLDGQGFIITALFIHTDVLIRIGLFGQTTVAAEISNLGVEDVDIATTNTISRAGALVGINAGTLSQVYSTGTIATGNAQTGGLVGANSGTIIDAYSRANVTNSEQRGSGLAGVNSGAITTTYAAGSVSAGIGGGLVTTNTGTITSSFWDVESSGQGTSMGGTGKTTEEMKAVATFTDTDTPGLTTAWDFAENPNDDAGAESTWDIDPGINDGYPFLTFIETTVPDAPTGLSATALSTTEIDLSWSAPADDGDTPLTGYHIERKIAAGAFATLVVDTGNTTTTYSDTGLAPATLYTYRVSAINGVGTGAASGEAFATTGAEPAPEVEEEDEDGDVQSSHRRSAKSPSFSSDPSALDSDSVSVAITTLRLRLIDLLTQLLEQLLKEHNQTS